MHSLPSLHRVCVPSTPLQSPTFQLTSPLLSSSAPTSPANYIDRCALPHLHRPCRRWRLRQTAVVTTSTCRCLSARTAVMWKAGIVAPSSTRSSVVAATTTVVEEEEGEVWSCRRRGRRCGRRRRCAGWRARSR